MFVDDQQVIDEHCALPANVKIDKKIIPVNIDLPNITTGNPQTIDAKIAAEVLTVPGNKQWMVFVNGFSSSIALWAYQRKYFLENGWNLVCYDQIGQGESSRPQDVVYSMQGHAESLDALLTALKIKDFVLFGLSAGGMITQEYAIRYPEKARAIVLASTSYACKGKLKLLLDTFENILTSALPDQDKLQLFYQVLVSNIFSGSFVDSFQNYMAELIHANVTRNTIPGLLGAVKGLQGFDRRDDLANIKVPTVIVGGEYDALFSLTDLEHMNSVIPNSRRVILLGETSSHALVVEMFEDLNEAVLHELQRIHVGSGNHFPVGVENTFAATAVPEHLSLSLNF